MRDCEGECGCVRLYVSEYEGVRVCVCLRLGRAGGGARRGGRRARHSRWRGNDEMTR